MTTKNNKQKLALRGIIFFFIISFAVIGFSAFAAGNNLDQPFGDQKDMGSLTQAIFQFAIAACVLAACIYIAIGAFYYFAAAGGDAKLAAQGKEKIQNAIIGLVLALVSWVILNTIHPQFTKLEISKPNQSSSQ